MAEGKWRDIGPVADFTGKPLTEVRVGKTALAISWSNGTFGAVSSVCNHAGGPLGNGRLDGEYIVCPWHNWKFHRLTGEGEPGFEADRVPRHEIREENGRLLVNLDPASKRNKAPHDPHPLERPIAREKGPVRLLGISTTNMDVTSPRYSTSDVLLDVALEHAAQSLAAETKCIRVRELAFRSCEGYYSKSAHACTWPCSITQMDPGDQLDRLYEALVFWADAVIVATPIRWGSASSLYFKMIERMNCIQNQVTIKNRVLIRNKVAGFIITGGQDNVQAVAGQALMFFSELGFQFPQFPFIAHSRGWSAEDMEHNIDYVMGSEELRDGARDLARRSVEMAKLLLDNEMQTGKTERGGRKAHHLTID